MVADRWLFNSYRSGKPFPGMGLFLGGLGALLTGIVVHSGIIDANSFTYQLTAFFGFTTLFAVLLWKPLAKFRTKNHPSTSNYNDVIGTSGIVTGKDLKHGELGQIVWSGTIMNAELASSVLLPLPIGSHVTVISFNGTTLKVTPKE